MDEVARGGVRLRDPTRSRRVNSRRRRLTHFKWSKWRNSDRRGEETDKGSFEELLKRRRL